MKTGLKEDCGGGGGGETTEIEKGGYLPNTNRAGPICEKRVYVNRGNNSERALRAD